MTVKLEKTAISTPDDLVAARERLTQLEKENERYIQNLLDVIYILREVDKISSNRLCRLQGRTSGRAYGVSKAEARITSKLSDGQLDLFALKIEEFIIQLLEKK